MGENIVVQVLDQQRGTAERHDDLTALSIRRLSPQLQTLELVILV